MGKHRRRNRFGSQRTLLLFLVFTSIGLVFFVVDTDRRSAATLATLTVPPEVFFHNQLSLAISEKDDDTLRLPRSELQPALDTIAAWESFFLRKKNEVNGDEWDIVYQTWHDAETWEALAPEDIDRMDNFLNGHKEFLAELRRVSALGGPMAAVPPYPETMDMEHLREARDSARFLALNIVYRARSGDGEAAAADIATGFLFAAAMAPEPNLISQFTRYGCAMITYHAILDAFPPGMMGENEVARIFLEVQKDPGRAPLLPTLVENRNTYVNHIATLLEGDWADRYSNMNRTIYFSSSGLRQKASQFVFSSPLARPWIKRDLSNASEVGTRIANVALLPYYEALQHYETLDVGFAPYTWQLAQSLPSTLGSQARHEALLQLLQLGLTLEQFAIPPETLDVLTEQFPEATLTDPFSGMPFIYRPNGDSFLLYSVGRNGTDDGGQHNFVHGDIVWRGVHSE